jgi:RNA-directed DNA polymerase
MKHPVIVLIDNDDGATQIFKLLQGKKFGATIGLATDLPFYHLGGNLYLVKTPIKGADNESCPEDFFDPTLLATKIDGKTFNPDKEHDAPGEFGKVIFAERIVRPKASTIDFSGFDPLLTRIEAVLDDYAKRATTGPTVVTSPADAGGSVPKTRARSKAAITKASS